MEKDLRKVNEEKIRNFFESSNPSMTTMILIFFANKRHAYLQVKNLSLSLSFFYKRRRRPRFFMWFFCVALKTNKCIIIKEECEDFNIFPKFFLNICFVFTKIYGFIDSLNGQCTFKFDSHQKSFFLFSGINRIPLIFWKELNSDDDDTLTT